ncbi:MAG TPA: hypothetical protein VEM76_13190 [Anaeromyxobacteraceae bacterium]|nr:hypothetical protein [Anaeromyxobacteraceae bacterium]
MQRKTKTLPLVGALVAVGCGGRGGPTAPDADGAWMESATVEVSRDEAAGRQTVTLVDPKTGFSLVVSDEPLTPGVIEVDDQSPAVAALTWGLSS